MNEPPELRLVCCHKQKTSARTRFLRLGCSVLAFSPLPFGAALQAAAGRLRPPADEAVRNAERRLALPAGSLELDEEFHAWTVAPTGESHILLAAFTSIDPPFAAAERVDGRFVPITELADLPRVELEILRRLYEHLIG